MGRAWQKCVRGFCGKMWRKGSLGVPKCGWVEYFGVYIGQIELEHGDLICLA
jgi:hypothetical protein